MSLVTQIGGNQSESPMTLKETLARHSVHVTHPLSDGSLFSSAPWSRYEGSLHYFQAITQSDFHVVSNLDSPIDIETALGIMFAMLHNKPIVLLARPKFEDTVGTFAEHAIMSRLSQMTVRNLSELDDDALTAFLKGVVRPVDYAITSREKTLINSRIRAHFRNLLAPDTAEATASAQAASVVA